MNEYKVNESVIDRYKGGIYGLAIGDALGLGTEGMTDEDILLKVDYLQSSTLVVMLTQMQLLHVPSLVPNSALVLFQKNT